MSELVEEGRMPEEQIVDGSELSILCKVCEVIQHSNFLIFCKSGLVAMTRCYKVNLMLKYFDINNSLHRVATNPSC